MQKIILDTFQPRPISQQQDVLNQVPLKTYLRNAREGSMV
jgi:hypothetical protein